MQDSTRKTQSSLYVISGPSGSGKTTICRKIASYPNWFYSISHTTRPRRPKESDGVDYYFVDRDEFEAMVKNGDFLEWAMVHDRLYGTSKKMIQEKLDQNQNVIMDLDTQGAASIKAACPEATTIFLKVPSFEVLENRLRARKRDSDDEIKKRIENAKNEMKHLHLYDHVVLNDKLDQAVLDVEKVLGLKSEGA